MINESEEKVNLQPIDEAEIPLQTDLPLKKSESEYLLESISDICTIHFSAKGLPETLSVEKNPNYYIQMILDLFKQFHLIE